MLLEEVEPPGLPGRLCLPHTDRSFVLGYGVTKGPAAARLQRIKLRLHGEGPRLCFFFCSGEVRFSDAMALDLGSHLSRYLRMDGMCGMVCGACAGSYCASPVSNITVTSVEPPMFPSTSIQWSPQQESNLHLALRRHSFYPLNYEERTGDCKAGRKGGRAGTRTRRGPPEARLGGCLNIQYAPDMPFEQIAIAFFGAFGARRSG